MRFLEILDDTDADDMIIYKALQQILSIPFTNSAEIVDQLRSEYEVDETVVAASAIKAEHTMVIAQTIERGKPDDIREMLRKFKELYAENELLVLAQYRWALSRNPLDLAICLDFLDYSCLNSKSPVAEYSRARKNIPGSVEIWLENLLFSERFHEQNKLEALYSEALTAIEYFHGMDSAESIQLAVEFVGMLRRMANSLDLFKASIIALTTELHNKRLLKHAIYYTAAQVLYAQDDPESGRELMNELTSLIGANDASVWIKFAALEQLFSVELARSIFAQSLTCFCSPSAEIALAWLELERTHGTGESIFKARSMIRKAWGILQNQLPKRPFVKGENAHEMQQNPKRLKGETEGASAPLEVDLAPQKELSVFVNNIDFSVTESQLRIFFECNAGPVLALHIGKKATGEVRGFASVEFTDTYSVEKALALDRSRINGRPLFISRYQAVGSSEFRSPIPVRQQGRDPSCLYVSHLSPDTSEEALKALFVPYEGFEAVRLGLNKDGSCKGFAYVQFVDEVSANSALAEHGKIVNGNAISVLVSDSSLAPKKQHQKTSMLPPSLSRAKPKAKMQTSTASGPVAPTKSQGNPENESSGPAQPRSNSDFRKMLGL